ncbi:hypothetical protein ACFFX1_06530 [Dactylosporangium sucinum]|uniref:hypothetical protein n=1 Tax=Dactylosporangium sucinum TaxID=1424081 RepID=UPI00167E502A|nr:hypothetical protein [Dactylosporangium sucinum]
MKGSASHAQLLEPDRYHGYGFADHQHRSGCLQQQQLRPLQLHLLQLLLLLMTMIRGR